MFPDDVAHSGRQVTRIALSKKSVVMKRIKSLSRRKSPGGTAGKSRAITKLRKNLLKSLLQLEKVFSHEANPFIAEFRKKLNTL